MLASGENAIVAEGTRAPVETQEQPRVSVIIPVYKAALTLRGCLETVFASEGVSFEVIVINDCSPDESEAIALEFPCRVLSMKKNIMAANCRNLGAKHAKADILVFFDSDQLMAPNCLKRYVEELDAHPDADAIVGSLAADTPMPGFYSKYKNLRHHYVHQTCEGPGSTLASGLTAIHKRVFENMGGFEPAYQGASIEDIALGYKMVRNGHRILFRGNITAVHLKGYTLKELVMSDIKDRAVPWVSLMMRDHVWNNQLNTSNSNVMSVVFAWLMVLALMSSALLSWPALVAMVVFGMIVNVLNRGFVIACFKQFGVVFLIKALLFTPVMYFYHGIGLIVGLWAYYRGNKLNKERKAPEAHWEVLYGEEAEEEALA